MSSYKKTVKKYNNKKKTNSIPNKKNNKDNNEPKVVANSKKEENMKGESEHREHSGEKQAPANSNLKEMQNQDTLAKNKDNFMSILYCIIATIITIVAIMLIGKNVITKSFITSGVWLIGSTAGIIVFFLYYIFTTISICFITKSNKTDSGSYTTSIVLFTIVNILCFTLSLLLYGFDLFLPAAIISIVTTIISIYLTYRYFISTFTSGILQSLSTIALLYGTYVTLAFTLMGS